MLKAHRKFAKASLGVTITPYCLCNKNGVITTEKKNISHMIYSMGGSASGSGSGGKLFPVTFLSFYIIYSNCHSYTYILVHTYIVSLLVGHFFIQLIHWVVIGDVNQLSVWRYAIVTTIPITSIIIWNKK